MGTPGKRPFWMHQIAEYVIAALFIGQGLQSDQPGVPSVLGGLVLLNAACTKGPAAAFRLFGRALHRVIDLVLIALIVVVAVQPVFSLDNRTRVVLGALAFVLGFVWLGSDFSESSARERKRAAAAPASRSSSASKPAGEPATAGRRVAAPSRAEDIGRTAGRLAGKGVNIYREQAAKRRKP